VTDLPLTSSSKVDERRLLEEAGLSPADAGREPLASLQLNDMENDSLVKGTAR